MKYISKFYPVWIILVYFVTMNSSIHATEEKPLADIIANPDNAIRCVDLKSIDHTHIVEDGFILFYMRNKKIYLNALPNTCPGLKNADTFMYRLSIHRLCDVDIITVLYRMAGGFYPGPSCGLGLFYPVDKKIAKEISTRSKK